MKRVFAQDEQATQALGAGLARALGTICGSNPQPFVIFLLGDLGAGKTTLVRAVLRALGVRGAVRSPTYTLMERYPLAEGSALHMDLYRLGDPEELEFLGLRDESGPGEIMLVEWPQRGARHLPAADLLIELAAGSGATADATEPAEGRWLTVTAATGPGERVVSGWRLEVPSSGF